jgi:hypothetical protein
MPRRTYTPEQKAEQAAKMRAYWDKRRAEGLGRVGGKPQPKPKARRSRVEQVLDGNGHRPRAQVKAILAAPELPEPPRRRGPNVTELEASSLKAASQILQLAAKGGTPILLRFDPR